MKWDIRTIPRDARTAEAQRTQAEKSGFELYEKNQKHYKLRRPWTEAASKDASPSAGKEASDEPAPAPSDNSDTD